MCPKSIDYPKSNAANCEIISASFWDWESKRTEYPTLLPGGKIKIKKGQHETHARRLFCSKSNFQFCAQVHLANAAAEETRIEVFTTDC